MGPDHRNIFLPLIYLHLSNFVAIVVKFPDGNSQHCIRKLATKRGVHCPTPFWPFSTSLRPHAILPPFTIRKGQEKINAGAFIVWSVAWPFCAIYIVNKSDEGNKENWSRLWGAVVNKQISRMKSKVWSGHLFIKQRVFFYNKRWC